LSALQDVEWEDCTLQPRTDPELEREIRKAVGFVHPVVKLLAPCPWLARSFRYANLRDGQLVHLAPELADLIFLAVSQETSCRYCYASQRALLKIIGFDPERIRRVEEAAFSAEDDAGDRLALDFARRFARGNPPPGAADRAILRDAGLGDGAIQEVAYVASWTVQANRTTTLTAVPHELGDYLESIRLIRWFRPIVALLIRRSSKRGQPERLAPEYRSGPFAYVALALDGLPTARISRSVFTDAWASPILSERAKALAFAVVARGLGSARAEEEAAGLLEPLGIDGSALEGILANLASPLLDPLEAAIVPFARETVRVRPSDIQRKAHKLQEQLSVEQFLELVGVVSLANGTCRLSLALCES